MGILVDYQVDRATLDVLVEGGFIGFYQHYDTDLWYQPHGTFWDGSEAVAQQNSNRNRAPDVFDEMTIVLLERIERIGLWMKTSPNGVFLSEIGTDEARIVGSGTSLPLAVADYIKRKGE